MRNFIRITAMIALLASAVASATAATPSEFYATLLRRGISAYEGQRYADAAKQLRIAAFGMVEAIDQYQVAQVYLTLAYDKQGETDKARDAARRVVVAERVERRWSTVGLPTAVRTAFDAQAVKLLTATEVATLRGAGTVAPPPSSSASSASTAPRTITTVPPPTSTATPPRPAQTTAQTSTTTTTTTATPPRTTEITVPMAQTTTTKAPPPATVPASATTQPRGTTNNSSTNTATAKPPAPAPAPQTVTATPPRTAPPATTQPQRPATQSTTQPQRPATQSTTQPQRPATQTTTQPQRPATQTTTQQGTNGRTTAPAQTPAQTRPAPAQTQPAPSQTAAAPAARTFSPGEIATRLIAAERALNTANLLDARRVYRELLASANLPHETLIRIAEGLYRARDFAAALQGFTRAGTLRRGEEPYRYYIAVAAYETGDTGRAKKELAAALPFIEMTPDVARYRARIEGAL
jgi:hypothetical protein